MFTGIVEERGEVVGIDKLADAARLSIRGPITVSDAQIGDSIAVNGVCLTVTSVDGDAFTADVMLETLQRSSLGALSVASSVNLERPVTLQTRLGGHLVQGHVDGVGTIRSRTSADHWEILEISLPDGLGRYVVDKGSVTVDGVSLTVSGVEGDAFAVSLIPTTLELTTLADKQLGDPVNIEVDVVAKYVERLVTAGAIPKPGGADA